LALDGFTAHPNKALARRRGARWGAFSPALFAAPGTGEGDEIAAFAPDTKDGTAGASCGYFRGAEWARGIGDAKARREPRYLV